jgi:biopolymer transport protein ExbB
VLDILRAAGWPIWPLLAASVIALALVIERFLSLRAANIQPAGLVDDLIQALQSGRVDTSLPDKLAASSLLGQILSSGVQLWLGSTRPAESVYRQTLENAGRAACMRLDRYLNALGTIATAAPLMGLLGTVIGMIEIFGAQAPGSSGQNPMQLAHGISVALYNTAFGLIVAIPALMFYRYFRNRVEQYRLAMELAVERVLPHLLNTSKR